MQSTLISPTYVWALLAVTVAVVGASGCATQAAPAPDLDTTFSYLTKQLEGLAATLKQIPDEFVLDTPKKVKAANQLLDDAAKQLETQAVAFRATRASLRNYSNMTGEFDDSGVTAYVQAIERFDRQWERIEKNNRQATQRLGPLRQIVQDAT
jgi:hypothetical protein